MTTVTHIESEAKFRRRFGDAVPFKGPGFYDKETGAHDDRPDKPLGVPYIIGDVQAHVHDGVYVSSRSTQRDMMREKGLVEYERTGDLATAPKGVYDPNCDKWKQWMKDKTHMVAKRAGLDPANSTFERTLSGELAEVKKETLAGKKRKKA